MNTRRYVPAVIIAATLGIGILAITLLSHGVRAAREGPVAADAKLLSPTSPAELSSSFVRVADDVGPAVVNIRTETTVHLGRGKHREGADGADGRGGENQPSPFEDFFDRYFHSAPGDTPREVPEASLGSGLILDQAGYILTNYHVITRDGEDRPVDRMRVNLQGDEDGSKGYVAKIVGVDKWTDLAVIKIDAGRPLPVAALGDSDSMHVGDWVLAIGSPFGLSSTVTAGIVSAKGRGIEGGREGEFKRFIQTDAAINPGNSGGPLVNLAGQVIGINTAIATNRDAYDGVGFAIPSNTVRSVYNAIISKGFVYRGAIGVTFTNGKNAAVLESFGAEHGVVVDSVQPSTPAERAGLERGDVITGVGSKPVEDGDQLLAIISGTKPGDKLKLDYLRDRKALTAEIIVGDWNKIVGDTSPPDDTGDSQQNAESSEGVLGLSVKNLTADQARDVARQLRLPGPEGVVVTDVKPGSFADDLGFERMDVILGINRKNVGSVDEFNRMQSQLKRGDNVLLLVARQVEGGFTTVFLADRLP